MPRVPYRYPEPGTDPVADEIRKRRQGGKLLELDGALLNAPDLAAGYSSLLGAVRQRNSLPDDLRELLILRVAALNGAAYEWLAHAPIGQKAGLTSEQLAVIRDENTALSKNVDPNHVLSDLQRTALAYADWMTKNVHVPQDVFDTLKGLLDNKQIVEVTMTVSAYNAVSRILIALDVGDKAGEKVPEVPGH
ncbi:carboxymuconolactone decarboxylase [Phanerochaete sordida]|uniref:Carboxymuconolactone decarboxylase n=1 Tax=Phanerochaete sordida TaxID=48140 RepID=A0A9P3FXU8_9APHY|nr:carboxymuconolactone decarboxylase [Phanerochaete sordida]